MPLFKPTRNNTVGPNVADGPARRLRWRSIILPAWLLFIVVAAMQTATSVFIALRGSPATLIARHFYWPFANTPFAFIKWGALLAEIRRHPGLVTHVYSQTLTQYLQAIFAGLLVFFLGLAAFTFLRMRLRAEKPNPYLHGSARWASRDDLVQAGLVGRKVNGVAAKHEGVFVGQWRDPSTGAHEFLRHDGPEHVAAIAPTRSGKGVGLVVPTLLSWVHSVVVNDIKAELYAMTSGWRAKFANNRVCAFQPGGGANLTDPATGKDNAAYWNPLFEVRLGGSGVGDAESVAQLLVDPDGKGIEDDHWLGTSKDLFWGMILYLVYIHRENARNPHLAQALRAKEAALAEREREAKDRLAGAVTDADKKAAAAELAKLQSVRAEQLQSVRADYAGQVQADPDPFAGNDEVRAANQRLYAEKYKSEPPPYDFASLGELSRHLSDSGGPDHPFWGRMAEVGAYLTGQTDPGLATDPEKRMRLDIARRNAAIGGDYEGWGNVILQSAKDMMARPEDEAGSVLSTAKRVISLYRDPIVARSTNCSDFSVADLMDGERPMSLYIITPPGDKGRLRPVIRLLLNTVIRKNATVMEYEKGRAKQAHKHRLLLLIDEFPSLGRLAILEESLAYVAGYGMKYYLICQDKKQLEKPTSEGGYGANQLILAGCQVKVAFPPNDDDTAEFLSKACGTTTVVQKQVNFSGAAGHVALTQAQESIQQVSRPLLTPDEVKNMPAARKGMVGNPPREGISAPGNMLVFTPGCPAIYGVQPLYFKVPSLNSRVQLGPVLMFAGQAQPRAQRPAGALQ